jgi:hypothetical protein
MDVRRRWWHPCPGGWWVDVEGAGAAYGVGSGDLDNWSFLECAVLGGAVPIRIRKTRSFFLV